MNILISNLLDLIEARTDALSTRLAASINTNEPNFDEALNDRREYLTKSEFLNELTANIYMSQCHSANQLDADYLSTLKLICDWVATHVPLNDDQPFYLEGYCTHICTDFANALWTNQLTWDAEGSCEPTRAELIERFEAWKTAELIAADEELEEEEEA